MPLLLRKIRRSKWHSSGTPPWLQNGEIQADALGDIRTDSNNLSVWEVEDDKSNLDQVITALAASCDSLSNLDYSLFDKSSLSKIGIKAETNKGKTPYERANNLHRDLIELTATKIVKLAEVMLHSSSRERVSEKQILTLIKAAVNSQQIDITRLNPNLAKKLI